MAKSVHYPVFTIGHSLLTGVRFIELLKAHEIQFVLDVRTSPFSRRAPQFNRHQLSDTLLAAGLNYSFAGRSLGGRPADLAQYEGGRASYDRMAATTSFQAAIRRIATAAKTSTVAMMCAESDPIECHRFLLIGRALQTNGLQIQHILSNGTVESHSHAEERMLARVGFQQADIFAPEGDHLAAAYAEQSSRFAFVIPGFSTTADQMDFA